MIKRQILMILFMIIFLPVPGRANTVVIAQGSVYEQRCALCHGSDGIAEIPGVPNLTQTTMNIDQIMEVIENGRGQMPIIRIDAEQRHEAAKFVLANIKE